MKSQARSKSGVERQGVVGQLPAEEARSIGGVILRIAAAGQVAEDAAASLGRSSRHRPTAARAASCRRRLHRPPPSRCPGAALRRDRGRALQSQKPASRCVIRPSYPPGGPRPRSITLGLQLWIGRSNRDKTQSPQLSTATLKIQRSPCRLSHRTVIVPAIGRSIAKQNGERSIGFPVWVALRPKLKPASV